MAKRIYAAGAETNENTEFQVYGANISTNSTNPKTGTYCYLIDYNYILGAGNDDIDCYGEWSNLPSYRNFSVHIQFRTEGTPANQDILLFKDEAKGSGGDVAVYLTTARKIKVATSSGSSTGTTVLNTAQYYQIEVRVDKTGDGKVYLRINETDELNRAVVNNARTAFSIGWEKKDDTVGDPAVQTRFDDIVLWIATAGEAPPWLNTTPVHYRTVNAAGAHNDYTGTGDAVNKYNNVDEVPAAVNDGDTTNNAGGSYNTTQKQDHNLTDATPSGTLKGFTFYAITKPVSETEADVSTNKLLVRDSAVDYETALAQTADPATYHTEVIGYQDRPGGGTLTAAALNAMNIGSSILADPHTALASYFHSPNSGNSNTAALKPDADGTDDGLWTLSAGTNAYALVDEDMGMGLDSSPATYIYHDTIDEKQGFSVPAPTVNDRVITGVTIRIWLVNRTGNLDTSGNGKYKVFYRTSGGTYYYSDPITISVGAEDNAKTWSTNPDTGNAWTASEINNGQFGVVATTLTATKTLEVDAFNVCVDYRGKVKNTALWLVTAHGDAPTTFSRFTPKMMVY